ncbi:hypothetical protein [Streptomyces sp. NRRL S-87]|uniref:hypothetical protein n=1 Tax=Streptomyces sp. NRRL S-87 TaxID=1463920 RepID=UPI0004C29B17|nr:hypothetical protein [Streptomyces sp. NRRL S-87]
MVLHGRSRATAFAAPGELAAHCTETTGPDGQLRRSAVLARLLTYLRTGAPPTAAIDVRTPLWEQTEAVAAEVWAPAPVDPWALGITPEPEAAWAVQVWRTTSWRPLSQWSAPGPGAATEAAVALVA